MRPLAASTSMRSPRTSSSVRPVRCVISAGSGRPGSLDLRLALENFDEASLEGVSEGLHRELDDRVVRGADAGAGPYSFARVSAAISRVRAVEVDQAPRPEGGAPVEICAHSFRGTGITEYLRNGGDLAVTARIAGHESTRTTLFYNRLREEISLDEIERIHI